MINIVGPKNHFRLDEGASDYLLIAGGIGITPIIAMADRLKELSKPYKIHYAGRRRSSMAFVDRLERDHSASLNRHHYIILFSATDCGATDNCLGRG